MALREILAEFGVKFDDSEAKRGDKTVTGLVDKLKSMGLVLGAGAVAMGVKRFVTDMQAMGDDLADSATALGVSTKSLQSWRFAAKLAGVESTGLDASMKFLSKNASGSNKAFGKLGVDVKDASGNVKNADVLMREVGVAIGKLPNASDRTAAALELMGKAGSKLIPVFVEGEQALNKALGEVDALGGGLTDDLIPQLQEAGDHFDRWDMVILSVKSRIALALFPIVNKLAAGMVKLGKRFLTATKDTNLFKAAMITAGILGAAAAVKLMAAWGPALLRLALAWAGPIIGILLLTLAIDDFLTFLGGGKSVIGDFFDAFLGAGSAQAIAKSMKSDWAEFNQRVGETPGLLGKLEEAASIVGGSLVTFFRDELPEAIDMGMLDGLASMDGWVAGALGTLGDFLGAMAGMFTPEAMAELGASFGTAGANAARALIDGLVNGITGGAQWVIDAVTNLGGSVIAALMAKLKAKSPSQVMSDIGDEAIGGGLIQGLVRAGQGVQSASAHLGAVATDGLRKGVSVPATASRGASQVDQRNTIAIHIAAMPGQAGMVDAARQGVRQGLGEDRGAMLAALE